MEVNVVKEIVLRYLENAHDDALLKNDKEMVCRLTRAMIAFSCDDLDKLPTWEEMLAEYKKVYGG
jgi:hypothetical protein